LIENYTWKCYKHDKGFLKGLFLRRSNYVFDIRWGYVDFKHETNPDEKKQQTGQSSTKDTTKIGEASADEGASGIDAQVKDLVPQANQANKKDVELYFSEYENETGTPQKYTFTATRQTTTSTRFELQESYKIGAETNLEINLAEIVKIGAKMSGEFSVTKTKAEEFSKTLTWNIDTEIVVPSWNKAKASLYVYEIPTKADFVVKTTISLPTGNLPVTIRRVKDGKEVHTEWINDLDVLFDEDYKNRSSVEVIPLRVIKDNGDEVMENHIVLTTRGVCKNVSFKNQHVKVECKKIKGAPKSATDNKDGGE
jgi:hypothetical protein